MSKPLTRLAATLTSALAATVFAGSAAAQQVVLKVHHFLPATSSAQVRLIQPWCDKIAKESGDKLKCQIYPSMQLGGTPPQLFDQARDGVADIVWTVPTYAAGRFTKAEVFELPWMAVTAKASSQALWTYTQKYAMDEFKGTHLLWMHMHDGALFHFTSKRPKTLEDMKGLKIRAATRSNSHMITALGATPVQMPLPGVPDALSKGIVDGASVPWEGTPAIKLTEIASYALDVPLGSPRISNTIFAFTMNQAKYDGLPADLKKVIDDNSGLAASAWAGEVGFDAIVEPFKKAAIARGNTLAYLTDAEYQRWVKATETVDDQWVKEAAAKGADGRKLIEEAKALIKQYGK
ncbi:MAG TPA: TRAP transporter substrate-binding protein [Burkholderiaceae bacterium]|nr:TRAP transporter substrate-binding protein [Burkholderiaceae bacterium]